MLAALDHRRKKPRGKRPDGFGLVQVDPLKRRQAFADRPARKAHLQVRNDDGGLLAGNTVTKGQPPIGTDCDNGGYKRFLAGLAGSNCSRDLTAEVAKADFREARAKINAEIDGKRSCFGRAPWRSVIRYDRRPLVL
ncbi:hypothetical protein [Sinorhizobium medicae]